MNLQFIRVHRWQLAILYLSIGFLSVHAEEPASGKKSIDFDRQIRPLLSENCFACHGPDDKQRKADLRLDQRAGAVGTDKVIVPGKSATSELWVRISEHDPSRLMPPRKSGKKLSPEQIDLFRRWIDEVRHLDYPLVIPAAGAAALASRKEPRLGAIPSTASFWPAWKRKA